MAPGVQEASWRPECPQAVPAGLDSGNCSNIGSHYLVTSDGKVHKGRANSEVGAHCKGDNATSVGICSVGKSDALPVGEGHRNQAIWDGLLRLARQLISAYSMPISRVAGHRERPSGRKQGKTCPGFDSAAGVADWRRWLR